MKEADLKDLLDFYVEKFNRPSFIGDDPICIPHAFTKAEDIEIAGFWTAVFSWGQRKTIINKARTLLKLMDDSPYDFTVNHTPSDRRRFETFVHRTFQYTDTLYFLRFTQHYYRQHSSLEEIFLKSNELSGDRIHEGLKRLHHTFFDLEDAPKRTRKHISTPERGSTCKRLNMFLRWMVRQDDNGVDFGIWKRLRPKELQIPLDVHVDRIARRLKLISRKRTDWLTVTELTEKLKRFDSQDPTKYDFALFGLGVLKTEENW